jgi:RNA polymerase sigma factor (sigma-70 family)
MTTGNSASSQSRGKGSIDADSKLVKAVTSRSIPAWHEFVTRYSGLIHSVVRRHLPTVDSDEIRSVYVDILEALYNGELAMYRGEARLSTWLIVFARNRTIDALRRRSGRIRAPVGYDRLSEFDKKVLRLYYVDGRPLEIVMQVLGRRDVSGGVDDIVEAIERIEDTLDPRYLRKLEDERRSRKCGAGSVRTLRYLIHRSLELEDRSTQAKADHALLEAEALEAANRVRDALSALSSQEREILALRFDRGWPAGKIAERLDLKSPRRVYRLIERALKKLRKAFPAD